MKGAVEMNFKSFDGRELFVYEWLDVKEPVGFVQIVHGMAEHAARYAPFAAFLNAHGCLVAADDHRGHGKTGGDTPGFCQGDMFDDVVRDEAALTDYYKAIYPGLPYILFGFSFGSFVTQSYIARYGEKLDGAVIGGSAYKKDFDVYLGTVTAALIPAKKPATIIEKLSFGAYAKQFEDGKWISNDPENNAAYDGDPLCGFTCSARFYRDFFRGLRRLYTPAYIAGLPRDLPLLLASGADDPVGNMGAGVRKLEAFYREKAGMKDVTVALFDRSRHEFLNEKQDRELKWGTVLAFLDRVSGVKTAETAQKQTNNA